MKKLFEVHGEIRFHFITMVSAKDKEAALQKAQDDYKGRLELQGDLHTKDGQSRPVIADTVFCKILGIRMEDEL